MDKTISIIVAIADNRAIGRGGNMPWHLSEDLKYFKRVTTGHTVIMGRRTWESIGCRPLPGRKNIVISGTVPKTEGIYVVQSISEAIDIAESQEVFIMGGGSVYASTIDIADNLYITEVHKVIEDADTFFPEIDFKSWVETFRSEDYYDEKHDVHFEFVKYQKR